MLRKQAAEFDVRIAFLPVNTDPHYFHCLHPFYPLRQKAYSELLASFSSCAFSNELDSG